MFIFLFSLFKCWKLLFSFFFLRFIYLFERERREHVSRRRSSGGEREDLQQTPLWVQTPPKSRAWSQNPDWDHGLSQNQVGHLTDWVTSVTPRLVFKPKVYTIDRAFLWKGKIWRAEWWLPGVQDKAGRMEGHGPSRGIPVVMEMSYTPRVTMATS